MSMHGEVHTWYMTEEERLEYIKKHPIVPYEKPKGSTFVEIHDAQYKRAKEEQRVKESLIDNIDKEKAYELYKAGETLKNMAIELYVSESTLNNFLYKQRQLDPEKWPRRIQTKEGGNCE